MSLPVCPEGRVVVKHSSHLQIYKFYKLLSYFYFKCLSSFVRVLGLAVLVPFYHNFVLIDIHLNLPTYRKIKHFAEDFRTIFLSTAVCVLAV